MRNFLLRASLILLIMLTAAPSNVSGQGIMLSASGPVNRSMGGAAVAAPLEALGALRWNPATISALPSSEIGFGIDLVWPHVEADSSIAGVAAGTTTADPGVTPIPAVGWVHQGHDSVVALGLGVFGVAGFRSNYPSSLTNPLFLPQSNAPGVPGGLGRIYTEAQFIQLAPTLSVALSERLSIGISPLITLGQVVADPLIFAAPDDADGSGVPTYPSGRGTHFHWGGGVQAGVYYIVSDAWRVGGAIKSPDWMEPFEFHTEDELGRPRRAELNLDLPMIVSAGVSYAGLQNLVLALDLRYFDYKNTEGLGDSGFNPDGSLRGLGWESIFALGMGVQYHIADPLYIRLGYVFNENPSPADQAVAAVAAPLHYQHQLNVGGSCRVAENVWLHGAYSFWFEHEVTGPIVTPLGAVPNASVTSREHVHIATFGVSMTY